MKIGFDAKRAFHNFRGLGHYSRNLIDGLNNSYDDLDLFLFSPESSSEITLSWAESLKRTEIIFPENYLSKKCSSLWRSLFLSSVLKKNELDIYHGLSHELPPGIKNKVRASVVTIHDLIFLRFPQFFPWVDRQVYLKKYKASCRRADLVVAICENTKSDLINLLGVPSEKIRVAYQSCHTLFEKIYSQVDLYKGLDRLNLPKNYFLQIGAIEENKNLLLSLRAFGKIQKEFPDLFFVVVGGNGNKDYKDKVNREIKNLNITNKVIFKSFIQNSDLPFLYQGAKSLIFPSFYEGFGIPIIESMVSGTPVITSKGGCFRESGGPHNLYIDPHSEDDLASAMLSLLTNEKLRLNITKKNSDFVKKFHWKNTSKVIRGIYQEVL
ncbi:glycosyltransferase family 4 protein [Bacteriovoracales bacterium]|nr:glycosyltransferase family 4 protein [Bacteriovoracales bacterium]